ncbi:MAG TPA: ABC transporter substrate-binding protein [Stellaceae bacterium]|jgi:branched-chain amino acid transport system substrate-binding protein|nr:ABC transporter substrate-binding protein [Stellaceae bacterium]
MGRKLSIAALGAALAGGLFLRPAAAEPIKIGIILTYSGPNASLGDQIDKGLRLYVKEHEKDLPPGTTVELVRRDDTGPNPDVARRLAQELVTRDHVQFLTGVVWSPNAGAIAPIASEAKVPFIISNAAAAGLTRASPEIARVSFTLWQESLPLGTWAAQKGGMKKVYIAVSDFAPGKDAGDAFTKGFTDAGGQIVDIVRFPLKDPDFVPFMQRIKDAKPDAVFVFVPSGKQATAVMKAYNELNMKGDGIKIIGPQDIVPDEELPSMGQEPLGVISAGTYSNAGDRPANKAYVAAWKREYGDETPPGFMSVGGWDSMAAIFSVIKAMNGKVDGDKPMALLAGWKDPDSPRGPIMIDPQTRDIVQNVYIRRVEKHGDRLANIEFETIPQVKDPWKELNPPK